MFMTVFSFSQNKNNNKLHFFETPSIAKHWNLDSSYKKTKGATFKLQKHKDVFVNFTSNLRGTNELPISENPLNTVTQPINYDNSELKFQISSKTQLLNNVLKSKLDVWAAYTQSSRWQVFNGAISRPFRETDYEPELIILYPINLKCFDMNLAYINIAINHQSNGRSLPYSRSWNRIIFELGLQANTFTLQLRPWLRFNEDLADDDNPEISNFIGRGEAIFTYTYQRFRVKTILRHTLKFNNNNRGAFTINLDYRLQNALSLNLQIFHGYGESILDYNYKQTMLSAGFSFL